MSKRTIIGVLAMAYLVGAPFVVQVMGWWHPALAKWRMYTKARSDVCVVSYTTPEGMAVDRHAVLGFEGWWDTPRSMRVVNDLAHARRQGRALCKRLDTDDLRLQVTCGIVRGWVPLSEDLNVCQASLQDLASERNPEPPYRSR